MAQGQETQDAYKFPQKGRDLDNLFQKLIAWTTQSQSLISGNLSLPKLMVGGGDVELTSKNNGGELYIYNEDGEGGGMLAELYAREYYAGNHRLTSKANSSDVVSAKEAQAFSEVQKAQARTNIGAASQSDLNTTNQEVAKKAEVIDLKQYIGTRVPTCDYEFMENYMPYYTYGEYPVQMGIVPELDEESNNDFYYVGRFTSDNGTTFRYLSFSNKGDWGFRGGNQGFFSEEDVPEALKQAIYAFGLSREKIMDAQDVAIGGKPLRTVKEKGVMVYPVSHSGAIVHDLNTETTVFEEIEALKQERKVLYVEFWDDETPVTHEDGASVGDLFYKTDTGVLYKAYEDDGEIYFGIEPILEGALYIYNYGDFFGIGKIVENAGVLHLLHYQSTAETTYKGLMSAEDKRRLNTIFNYGKTQGWWQ